MEELMLYVRYQAKPGCREKFVRQLVEEGILTLIRQEDGCLAYRALAECRTPARPYAAAPHGPPEGHQGAERGQHDPGQGPSGGVSHAV